MSTKFHRLLPVLGFAALAACADESAESASVSACDGPGLAITDAWVREASAAGASAAYFEICNGGSADDALVGVSFAGAGATEIHETVTNAEGVTSMAQIGQIALPAGAAASLKPGGSHVMLMGLTEDIADGAAPELTLIFENAEPVTIALEVRNVAAGAAHGGH